MHDHPYVSRSQIDLEAADAAEAEALRGAGGVAVLRAGDALFIPNRWWHHIHADDGANGGGCISLNLWFSPAEELVSPVHASPLPPHMHAQVARAVEGLVCRALPRRELAADAFEALATILDGSVADAARAIGGGGGPLARAGRKFEGVRNFVLRALATVYGRPGAARLCETFLSPDRWRKLRLVCFRDES